MRNVIARMPIKKVVAGLAALALVATAAVSPTPTTHADGPIKTNICPLKPDLVMQSIEVNSFNHTATIKFKNNGCATGTGFFVTRQVLYQNGSARTELFHPAMGAFSESQQTVSFAPGAKSIQVWLDNSQTSVNNAIDESDNLGNNYMSQQIGGVIVP